uniref:TIL domain-containing protein n=1 Tax=Globodera rostochiensis TaxID=31243 RepID=A0A914H3G1_GLORO
MHKLKAFLFTFWVRFALAISSNATTAEIEVNATQCPSLFGANYPTQQRELLRPDAQGHQLLCQWVIISDRQNCPQFFQHCGPNPLMCPRQNEIWFQCMRDCEPTCSDPSPSCPRRCPRGGCQCFPGYLREQQNGHCVAVKQCPGEKSGESLCFEDEECQGSSNICRDGKCHIVNANRRGCAFRTIAKTFKSFPVFPTPTVLTVRSAETTGTANYRSE